MMLGQEHLGVKMDIIELRNLCQKQLDIGGIGITLKQPGKWGKTNHRILFGVKGEIVQDNFGDGLIVMYPAKELLDAILKSHLLNSFGCYQV